jgi:hypothetical protein
MASDPLILLDESRTHWSMMAGLGGPSALGYHETVDNGDGTFTAALASEMHYAPWDLYVMGLIDGAELDPLFYVDEPSGFDPMTDSAGAPFTRDSKPFGGPVTFEGKRVDVTVEQLEASLGARMPAFGDAQSDFRHAFILLCKPGKPCSEEGGQQVETLSKEWPAHFVNATAGHAAVSTEL